MNRFTSSLLATASLTAVLAAQDPPKQEPPQNVTWKDLVRDGGPIKFYGFFRLDAYYNTARMDSVIIPSRVLPETEGTPLAGEAKRNDNQFALDPRLTRFGVDVNGPEVDGAKTTGKLEIDFANFPAGVAESRATPRIRLAYIDIKKDQLGLRVGQDWDVVSPLFPAVNGELLMWNAGNTGDRRAQIQGRWVDNADASKESLSLKAALALTGAITNEDLDTGTVAGERDGFDSGMPQIQVRGGYKGLEVAAGKKSDIGVWGMFGRTETDTFFNGENRFDTWLGGVDLSIPIASKLTVRAEAWTGANLGDIRGGMGQSINTATGEEIESSGGWAELICKCGEKDKTQFHVGASLDDPKNDDLSLTSTSANRRRNQSGYIGTVVDWDTKVRTGFDVIYWQSEYTGAFGTNGSTGNGVRFDLYFQFNF
jgi:hypothetical protein